MRRLPTYFLSHGGGPWPWMMKDQPGVYDKLFDSLRDITAYHKNDKLSGVLMVSGHWQAPELAIMGNPLPPMIYDFGGFPAYTYQVKYSAQGSQNLAKRVLELCTSAKITAKIDMQRGFDHGAYSVLQPMFPEAAIPVVQLSLHSNYNPKFHLDLGRALQSLRDEGVLLIGSGLSFHNLRMFGSKALQPSTEFDQWLNSTLKLEDFIERERIIADWTKAPSARVAHPDEDHLLPLMVALGAAIDDKSTQIYHEDSCFGGWAVSSFRFGA